MLSIEMKNQGPDSEKQTGYIGIETTNIDIYSSPARIGGIALSRRVVTIARY